MEGVRGTGACRAVLNRPGQVYAADCGIISTTPSPVLPPPPGSSMMPRPLAALAAAMFLASPVAAQVTPVTFWTGASGSVWNVSANWDNGVPANSGSVRFSTSAASTILNLGGATSAPLASVAFSGGGSLSFTLQNGTLLLNDNGEIVASFDAPDGLAQNITMSTLFQGNGQLRNGSLSGAALNLADVATTAAGTATLAVNTQFATGAINITGVISNGTNGGTFGVTKTGAGTLTLGSANTYTGRTEINGGVVSVATFAALGQSNDTAGNLVLDGGTLRYTGATGGATNRLFTLGTGGGTLDASGTATVFFGGSFALGFSTPDASTALTLTGSGTGSLAAQITDNGTGKTSIFKTGAGTWQVGGSTNTFTGPVSVEQGTLRLTNAGSAGTNAAYAVNAGGTLSVLQVAPNAPVTYSIGSLAGDGTVSGGTVGIHATTLSVGGDGTSTTFSGAIQNAAGITSGLQLTKVGAGTLTLSGFSTYTGATAIDGGTLKVDGSLDSAAAVNSGGTLAGSGKLNGLVTVNAGGTLAPGSSPGTITLAGGLTMTGGLYEVDIAGATPGIGYDQIIVPEGNVNLGSGEATLKLVGLTGSFGNKDVLAIIDNTGTGTTSGFFAGLTNGSVVPEMSVLGLGNWYIFYNADLAAGQLFGGNDVVLTPTPEPASVFGIGAAGLGATGWVRRRRSRPTAT